MKQAPRCRNLSISSLEATPLPIIIKGGAFSDVLMHGLTCGDADSLAPLNRQHYHGLLKCSPVGREMP